MGHPYPTAGAIQIQLKILKFGSYVLRSANELHVAVDEIIVAGAATARSSPWCPLSRA